VLDRVEVESEDFEKSSHVRLSASAPLSAGVSS
jgi:hypothetical protein